MKQLYAFLAVLALLPVLAGCQNARPAANQTNPTETQPNSAMTETTPTVQTAPVASDSVIAMITPEDAIAIALKDAGLARDQVRDLDIELDRDNGVAHYDVDFEKDDKDYDYEIHAQTGEILKSEKERD